MNNLPYIKRQFDFSDCFDLLLSRMKNIPKNSNSLEAGEGYSSAGHDILMPHKLDKLKNFLPFVREVCSEAYGEEVSEDEIEGIISRSWTNKHYKSGQSLEHKHDQVELVFACYVSAPKNSGNFEMFYNGVWNEIPVKTGDVLVFPGNVLHRSQVSESDDVRLVLTVNINRSHYAYNLALRDKFHNSEEGEMFVNFMNRKFIEFANTSMEVTEKIEHRLCSTEL